MCSDMCVDMRMDMCMDVCMDVCMDMRTDMRTDMRMDMCIDMCIGMPVSGSGLQGSSVHRNGFNEYLHKVRYLYMHALTHACTDVHMSMPCSTDPQNL